MELTPKLLWVRSIRDQRIHAGVPFHFKQWGGRNKKKTGRVLDGRTWEEWPVKESRQRLREPAHVCA